MRINKNIKLHALADINKEMDHQAIKDKISKINNIIMDESIKISSNWIKFTIYAQNEQDIENSINDFMKIMKEHGINKCTIHEEIYSEIYND